MNKWVKIGVLAIAHLALVLGISLIFELPLSALISFLIGVPLGVVYVRLYIDE